MNVQLKRPYRAVAETPHNNVVVGVAGSEDTVGEVGGVDCIGEVLHISHRGEPHKHTSLLALYSCQHVQHA